MRDPMNLFNRYARPLAYVLVAAVLTACAADKDPRREPIPLTDFKQTLQVKEAWTNSVGKAGTYLFEPIVVGSAVYAAGANGTVEKIDATNGQTLWHIKLDGYLSAGVGSDGTLTAVGGPQGQVYLLGPDGKLQWQASAEGEIITPPLVGNGYVVVRTIDGRVVAFKADTGEQKWVYRSRALPLNLRTTIGMIFVGQNAVLTGFPGGALAALSLETGDPFWQTAVSYPSGVTEVERINDVAGAPVLVGGGACAVTFQGRIGCFNVENGQPLWTNAYSSYGGVAQDGRIVASADDFSTVTTFEAATGKELWATDQLRSRAVTAPVILGDAIVVGDYQGYVHFLSRDTGAFVARVKTDKKGITARPVIAGNLLIVQSRSGDIYAYRSK
jgi:outer membrane protein assembly factor BamB